MLVTGGARGLGGAIASAAISGGYRVGIIDVDLDGAPEGAERYAASVTDKTAINDVLDQFGPPDVLVNNAGIVRFGPLVDLSIDDFSVAVNVNLVGTFVVSQACAQRWMALDTPGVIVNITSMNGVAAGPNSGAYGASKAGIALLTSQMAVEWGPRGIRVNAVAPGLIDAGMSAPIYAEESARHARESKVPLGRLGRATDIASTVLFLASDAAGYIHGQNLLVDGGVTGSVIAHLPRPESVDSVGHAESPAPDTSAPVEAD